MKMEIAPMRKLLFQKTPDEVFESESLQKYKERHHDISIRMLQINMSIRSLEIIVTSQFPWDEIYGPTGGAFWHLVNWNFRHNIMILMNTLVEDGRDVITLPRFLNEVRNYKWKDADDLVQYDESVKRLRIDKKKTQHIHAKIKVLRDNLYAHRLDCTLTEDFAGVSMRDLQRLFGTFAKMLEAVSFGVEHPLAFSDYLPIINANHQTSLEDVLDAVVKTSSYINDPDGELWPEVREYRSQEELDRLSHWRRRCGMSDA